MTTFKPGDKVTSPLLVGEWEVADCDTVSRRSRVWRGGKDFRLVELDNADLTLVTPSLPPEPPVGSVVRAHGRLWLRMGDDLWHDEDDNDYFWGDLVYAPESDLSAVVAVEDVAEWITDNIPQRQPDDFGQDFRAEFGGWGDE
jgi:hypothetical protein